MNTKYTCEEHIIHKEVVDNVKNRMLDDQTLFFLSEFFNAIKDPTRIKTLQALSISEMCVCDISAALAMSQSAISHQLSLLRKTALVKHIKKGRMVYYSLKDDHVQMIISQAIQHSEESKARFL